MKTVLISTVCLACLLLSPSPLRAHHAAFYKTVFKAIRNRGLDKIEELFSKSAWQGKTGAMSGPELQKRLEGCELAPLYKNNRFTRLNELISYDKQRSRCFVTFKLRYKEQDKPDEQIWLLAKHLYREGNTDPKAWQIVHIVDDQEEAESFRSSTLTPRVFPMKVGYKWYYAWGEKEVVFEVVRAEKVGRTTRFVVRRTIGESSLEFKLEVNKDGVYIHEEGGRTFKPPLKQFAFNVTREQPWKWEGRFDGKPRTEQFENIELDETTVPAGTFDTICVRQQNTETGDQATYCLAHGVGIVKLSGKTEIDPVIGRTSFEWKLKRFDAGKTNE